MVDDSIAEHRPQEAAETRVVGVKITAPQEVEPDRLHEIDRIELRAQERREITPRQLPEERLLLAKPALGDRSLGVKIVTRQPRQGRAHETSQGTGSQVRHSTRPGRLPRRRFWRSCTT